MPSYTILELWEHEWDRMVCEDEDVKTFLSNFEYVDPIINPRNALFGGRTEAIKLYHHCEPNEKIYITMTSQVCIPGHKSIAVIL